MKCHESYNFKIKNSKSVGRSVITVRLFNFGIRIRTAFEPLS